MELAAAYGFESFILWSVGEHQLHRIAEEILGPPAWSHLTGKPGLRSIPEELTSSGTRRVSERDH